MKRDNGFTLNSNSLYALEEIQQRWTAEKALDFGEGPPERRFHLRTFPIIDLVDDSDDDDKLEKKSKEKKSYREKSRYKKSKWHRKDD